MQNGCTVPLVFRVYLVFSDCGVPFSLVMPHLGKRTIDTSGKTKPATKNHPGLRLELQEDYYGRSVEVVLGHQKNPDEHSDQ
jgi:hypothetical protein